MASRISIAVRRRAAGVISSSPSPSGEGLGWCPCSAPVSTRRIIRRLARDRNIVDMAFAQPGAGDLDEFRALAQVLEGAAAGIAHRRLHATDKLAAHILRRLLARHLPLAPFGNQLHLVNSEERRQGKEG